VAARPSRITLKRLRRPLGDVLRTYKVVIDGNTVGDIRRGETKTCDMPPGRHEIHLEIDWAKSRNSSSTRHRAGSPAYAFVITDRYQPAALTAGRRPAGTQRAFPNQCSA
jgi:hypothetical protein